MIDFYFNYQKVIQTRTHEYDLNNGDIELCYFTNYIDILCCSKYFNN